MVLANPTCVQTSATPLFASSCSQACPEFTVYPPKAYVGLCVVLVNACKWHCFAGAGVLRLDAVKLVFFLVSIPTNCIIACSQAYLGSSVYSNLLHAVKLSWLKCLP